MLTQDILKSLLSYDPATGIFKWIKNGKVAGCVYKDPSCSQSYITIGINKKIYRAHRIAFLFMGEKLNQSDQVDHVDGNGRNNSWCNLRIVNNLENSKNQRKPKDNKSGIVGVSLHKKSNKWVALISDNGKRINLGYFECFLDACCARKSAERRLGYHRNHGR